MLTGQGSLQKPDNICELQTLQSAFFTAAASQLRMLRSDAADPM
jgi:hypothetical protein